MELEVLKWEKVLSDLNRQQSKASPEAKETFKHVIFSISSKLEPLKENLALAKSGRIGSWRNWREEMKNILRGLERYPLDKALEPKE